MSYLMELFKDDLKKLIEILINSKVLLIIDFTCCNGDVMVPNICLGLWICKQACNSQPKSLRLKTFFARDKSLSIVQIIEFVYYWLKRKSTTELMLECGIDDRAIASDWSWFCSEVIFDYLSETQFQQIGGRGKTVFCSYINFGVRKYHKDKYPNVEYVVAGFDLEIGTYFVDCIQNNKMTTIVQSLTTKILPFTRILTDCSDIVRIFKKGNSRNEKQFTISFSDFTEKRSFPEYKHCKNHAFYRRSHYFYAAYLTLFIFHQLCEIHKSNKFDAFMFAIGRIYNSRRPDIESVRFDGRYSDLEFSL